MSITRPTRLEAIQFADDGTLQIRLQKRVVVDGEIMKEEWHRTTLPPGADPAEQMGLVNRHLRDMGCEELPAEPVDLIRQVAGAIHTDAVKARYAERVIAAGGSRETEAVEPGEARPAAGGPPMPG